MRIETAHYYTAVLYLSPPSCQNRVKLYSPHHPRARFGQQLIIYYLAHIILVIEPTILAIWLKYMTQTSLYRDLLYTYDTT